MEESISKKKQGNTFRILVLALIGLASLCVYLIVDPMYKGETKIDEEAQAFIQKTLDTSARIRTKIVSQIEIVDELKQGSKGSDMWSSTVLMFETTLKNYVANIDYFISSSNRVNPNSVDTAYFERQLQNFKIWSSNASQMVEESRRLSGRIETVQVLEQKIDSLESVLSNQQSRPILNDWQVKALKAELKNYRAQIAQLKKEGVTLQFRYDSLSRELRDGRSTIDSLQQLLNQKQIAYQELEEGARKNSDLATRMRLWYFVNEKSSGRERRAMTNDEKEKNKGAEIKAIYGDFSLSSEIYRPFKVATVYLKKIEKTEVLEIAKVKVTVRNQLSGEFSIIPPEKLAKGTYNVEVEYDKKEVLKSRFFVTD